MEDRSSTWRASFVAVRILALYLMVHALILAAQNAFFLSTEISNLKWFVAVGIVGVAVAGVLLWFGSEGVATRIDSAIGGDGTAEQDPSTPRWLSDPKRLLTAGLGIVGVVIAVDGFAGLLAAVGQLISFPDLAGAQVDPLYWQIGSFVLRTVLGVWLLWRAQLVSAS